MHLIRRLGALAILLTVALVGCSSASAASVTIPDPTLPGPDAVTKVEYYGGSVLLSAPSSNGTATAAFQQPLDGALFYPSGPGPFDAVVLIHGNHSDCLTALGAETTPSSANCASTPGNTPLLNYEGYDYLAQNLASHGFVVISIDADALTSYQTSADDGDYLREQLIGDSLDMMYAWQDGAPLYVQTNPGQVETSPTEYSTPYALAGHIALENGVGIWGHSRGGEAVTDFVEYNRTRPSPGKHYKLDAVMAWAPVDYNRASVYGTTAAGTAPAATAYADVLPLCDGDVSDLHGARDFMNSLYPTAEPNDPSPKLQFAFQGGDHDYTNTIWSSSTSEDGMGYASTNLTGTTRDDAACGEDEPNNIRLTPEDQQTLTVALTDAFMQRYVQGNLAYDPLMTGAATLPADATGQTRGVAPAEELKTSYWAPANQRLDVLDPTPADLTSNLLGGSLSGTGFQNPYQAEYCVANGTDCAPAGTPLPATTAEGYDWCDPEPVEFRALAGGIGYPTAAKSCPLPPTGTPASTTSPASLDPVYWGGQANEREGDPTNRSFGPQLSLAWNGPAELDNEIPAIDGNVSNYSALTLQAAVNYFDSRNPPSGANNPAAETDPRAAVQNFVVQLTDAEGDTAQVQANNMAYGTALEAPLGSTRRNEVLNEIRIPLSAFSGIDLTQVRKVALIFGTTTVSGSIQIGNMAFQEAVNAPSTDPVIGAAPTTSPQAPAATPQATLLGAAATQSTPAATKPLSAAEAASTPVSATAIPVDGTNVVPKQGVCRDRTAPASHLRAERLTSGRLTVTGWATDLGCAATSRVKGVKGSVERVLVSVTRRDRHGCSFLGLNGRLRTPSACSKVYSLVAKGTLAFALRVPAKLPAGTYTIKLQAIDRSGNLEKAHGIRVHIRNGAIAGGQA